MSDVDSSATKSAMVTGASGGISLALCETLGERRRAIAAVDIDLKLISEFVAGCRPNLR